MKIKCKFFDCENIGEYRLPQTGDEFCEDHVLVNVIRMGILPESYVRLKNSNQQASVSGSSKVKTAAKNPGNVFRADNPVKHK